MRFFALGRQLNIIDYAVGSLARRPWRHLSIVLVFALVIFLVASFHLATSALRHTAAVLLASAPEITVQRMAAGRQVMVGEEEIGKLRGIFGVRRVYPRVWGYHFDAGRGANYTVIGLDPGRMRTPPAWAAGIRWPLRPGEAVLGRSLLAGLDLGGRKVFSLFRPDRGLASFRVAGLFPEGSDVLTGDVILTTAADARKLLGMPPGRYTDVCVTVANPAEVDTIARKIAVDILPGARVLTREQIRKTYHVVFSWRSGFGSICLVSALAAFFILCWDKASGLSAEERRETAILKVLGWQTGDIIALRFWEGGVVASLAFFLGVIAAWLHVALGGAFLFRPVMMGWSVLRPQLELTPAAGFADYLLIFSFTVLPYLAATVIPAWHSATVPPDAAVR